MERFCAARVEMNRNFPWATLVAVILCLLPCAAPAARPETVTHVVVFWLKRPGNVEDRVALRRASEKFRRLPGVMRVETGRGMPVARTGLEQAFDLCVVFTFANEAALRRFQAHPEHAAAVRNVLKPLVRRHIVFNSIAD